MGQLTFRMPAAFVALLFIAGPFLGSTAGRVGDAVSLGATALALPLILIRMGRAPRLVAWSAAFCLLYLASSLTTANTQTGLLHTIAAVTATSALLLFVTYGRDIIEMPGFRVVAIVLILAGAVAINFSSYPKNATGGTLLYLLALLFTIILTRPRRHTWPLIIAYAAIATGMSFALEFRGLLGYSAILVLGYIGAAKLPKRAFWVVGIVGSVAVIAATIWYFLNIATSPLAVAITSSVTDASGRRAASGREWLWPSILQAVNEHDPIVGLGAGTLPRDFLPTDLSSHNFYIQVFLQVGLIGLAVLIGLLLSVWKPLAASLTPIGWFGAAVFLMFVAHNSTEVLMFQNGLIAGVPAWCAIGLAISHVLVSDDEKVANTRLKVLATY